MFKNGPVTTAPQQAKGLIHLWGTHSPFQLLSAPADSRLYPLVCLIKPEESLPLSRPRCQVGNSFLLLSIHDDTHS